MRRQVLVAITVLLLLGGLTLATLPFAKALRPSAQARNDATTIITIERIQAGVLQKVSVDGRTLFILRPDAAQWSSIHQMDAYVWDKQMPGWSPELGAFVLWGLGTRWGGELDMKPANSSNMLNIYNDPIVRPVFFTKGEHPVWLGGYWGYRDEISYDLAGRTIKDWTHSYMGYTAELPNLKPVHFNQITPGKLTVYRYD